MIAEIDNQRIRMEIPNDPDEIGKAIELLKVLGREWEYKQTVFMDKTGRRLERIRETTR